MHDSRCELGLSRNDQFQGGRGVLPNPTCYCLERAGTHHLGCDDYHAHCAPKCCDSGCWCLKPIQKTMDAPGADFSAGRRKRALDPLVAKIEDAIKLAAQLGPDAFDHIEGRGLHATRLEIQKEVVELRKREKR